MANIIDGGGPASNSEDSRHLASWVGTIILDRITVFGQDILPAHASLDSGVYEYLVGQRWQCVRLVPNSAEMAASAVCSNMYAPIFLLLFAF